MELEIPFFLDFKFQEIFFFFGYVTMGKAFISTKTDTGMCKDEFWYKHNIYLTTTIAIIFLNPEWTNNATPFTE
jgi:hypothetical protein